MNRNIANKPHSTPDPEKPHNPARADRSGLARSVHGTPGSSDHLASQAGEAEAEEPTYDSCFDDLNLVLSQSMKEPDPDPNLGSAGDRLSPGEDMDPETDRPLGRRPAPPRTSEIFRSVVGPGGGTSPLGLPPGSAGEPQPVAVPGLDIHERRPDSTDAHVASESFHPGKVPWGQIALLAYSSILTLALIWLLWTGRIPKTGSPESSAPEKPVPEAGPAPAPPPSDAPAPPIPAENLARLGQTIRLGDLEVTPVAIEARPVDLVRTIDSGGRKREEDCLVLRLRLANRSKDQVFPPLDQNLVRERDLRSFDPYISASDGRKIRLFPLAMDSEWSIRGQAFPTLEPDQVAETFVAAEPASALDLPEEMSWRVRLRTGVYRIDMMEVKFSRSLVRRGGGASWDAEE
jgi:hypothetical protein